MHAITRNLITCAWGSCHQPGTMPVPHRSANTTFRLVDGIDRTHEPPVVHIEYCATHAAAVLELRLNQIATAVATTVNQTAAGVLA